MRSTPLPLIACGCLFFAGCLCFFTALNPSWFSEEEEGPAGFGGHVSGLEPPKRTEPVEAADAEEAEAEEDPAEREAVQKAGKRTPKKGKSPSPGSP